MDAFTSAIDIARAIRTKDVSPVEVADLYLERIEHLEPTLNAFSHRADDDVRGAAKRAADAVVTTPPDELPPFHGVPLPIKNLNPVAGWPCTNGSRGATREARAESDPIVERFFEAGFELLGMTNSPEFGTISYTESGAHGITRNPWDTERTPGGSSGGSAAAVASGMAPTAHGNDGGGTRRLRLRCRDRSGSRHRVVGLAVDPECATAVRTATEALAALGHEVHEVALDMPDMDKFVDSFIIIWNTGSAWSPIDDFDVLVTPTMAVQPPKVGSWREGMEIDPNLGLLNFYPMGVFTSIFNVTGLPALSSPLHQSADGLPVGVQLVAPPWRENLLLQLGTQLEHALLWKERRPALAN